MRTHDYLQQGGSLPRGSWHGVNPATQVVPPKKGKRAPYRRQSRRKGEEILSQDSSPESGASDRSVDFLLSFSLRLQSCRPS
ncbi:MAG: hypothetical protein C7B44_15350 [Sulfobacillus thermosulfidooxidans]|nr:MAG: hypothetical protein C7B44_15350 [Sulfobacillus thermosulfidooxidans]